MNSEHPEAGDDIQNESVRPTEGRATPELSASAIPALLESVKQQKRGLEDDIRAISGGQLSDVEEWIAQAKIVQQDIARCKLEAAEIVKEHEQVRKSRSSAYDAQNKVQLLQGEVVFTTTLHHELQAISAVKKSLYKVEESLKGQEPIDAAAQLSSVGARIGELRSQNAKKIFHDRYGQLKHDTHRTLDAELMKTIKFGETTSGEVKSTWIAFESEDHTGKLLTAMKHIGTLDKATEALANNIDRSVMQPILSSKSTPTLVVEGNTLSVESQRDGRLVGDETLIDMLRQAVKFLCTHLPSSAVEQVGQALIPLVVSNLISTRLLKTIPTELSEISILQSMGESASELATDLKLFKWPGHQELQLWVAELPMTWLGKRKMASLNALRHSLSAPRGPMREVERIERATISKQDVDAMKGFKDDLTKGLDEDAPERQEHNGEDEASAWGFDEDDDQPKTDASDSKNGEDDDGADAWGWTEDDDKDATERKTHPSTTPRKKATGGTNGDLFSEQEMTLVEQYTITDIPDHVLEIIGKDLRDAEEVDRVPSSTLSSVNPSVGLQAIPSHTLAMFRAMATTYYSTTFSCGNMHLYNDASYIVQKLQEVQQHAKPQSSGTFEMDYQVMDRFARAAYSREMELQRTIMGDILDGAQGFQNCTQQPYAMQCDTAVSSAVDRIRTMHAEWRPILSHTNLLSSIGSLLSLISETITRDIMDKEDIGDRESQRLVSFCNQVTALDDLYLPPQNSIAEPAVAGEERITVPQTVMYVPSWIRFQNLARILESSLAEIVDMWRHERLNEDFTLDEVVSLIRALFAESKLVRDAIAEIRSIRV